VAVRTGDTTQSERQRMIRRPPHILITTPESFHLILTSPRAREILRSVQHVIVDEIHALSDNIQRMRDRSTRSSL
jgi:ATP-dependent Lhr-like helicase